MADFKLSTDDNHAIVKLTLVDQDGVVIDLTTAADVQFQNRTKDPTTEAAMTVTDAPNGLAQVQMTVNFLKVGINEVGAKINWLDATDSFSVDSFTIEGIKT